MPIFEPIGVIFGEKLDFTFPLKIIEVPIIIILENISRFCLFLQNFSQLFWNFQNFSQICSGTKCSHVVYYLQFWWQSHVYLMRKNLHNFSEGPEEEGPEEEGPEEEKPEEEEDETEKGSLTIECNVRFL